MRIRYVLLLSALMIVALVSYVRAAWVLNGTVITDAINRQEWAVLAADGNGGVFLAWTDARLGSSNYDVYAQHIDATGAVLWTANGVAVCTAPNHQTGPFIIADGSGGVIIAWWDHRNGANADIYAQRLNSAGVAQWTLNGVAVCTATGDQLYEQLVSDGSGGAIVTWEDSRFGGADTDIFAQRLNAAGSPQWQANGVFVCGAAGNQNFPEIASDGSGGAIIGWEDYRGGTADIYAQRLSFFGIEQWAINGVAVCAAAQAQDGMNLINDGAGGAIIAWVDDRTANDDIFAQRLNSAGASLWTANGLAVCTAIGTQGAPLIATDGSGGAIVTWADIRSGDYDIYAQRVAAVGSQRWTFNGVAVTAVLGFESYQQIAADGAGGCVVTWRDGNFDTWAQRLNGYGELQWSSNGVSVSTGGADTCPLVNAGNGAAIMAWVDARSGNQWDIYAQRIELRYGAWGTPEPRIVLAEDNPADQGGVVALNWDASQRDERNQRLISHYSVWRAVDAPSASVESASSRSPVILKSRDVAADFHGPAVFVEHTPTTTYYWEFVGSQSARYTPGYSMLVATRQDAVINEPAVHYFQVLAHTFDQFTFWESNVMSGSSVDNLAPVAPLLLTAQRVGTDVQLHWNRAVAPDLRDYAVYRATSSGVTPVPINFLASAEDTVATDANAPSSALYYIVTAYDVHANQSDPSNEAHVGSLTGIGNLPAVTALTVLQNHPNPFTATTEFQIGLPQSGDVRVDVFDVAGRRVMTMDAKGVKGWQRIPFAARDQRGRSLASGVYFARVSAAGKTITKKMVIAR